MGWVIKPTATGWAEICRRLTIVWRTEGAHTKASPCGTRRVRQKGASSSSSSGRSSRGIMATAMPDAWAR